MTSELKFKMLSYKNVEKNSSKKDGKPQENPTSLSFYLPNVRLLLRRNDFSLKDTMRTTSCSINIPHQSTTPTNTSSKVVINGDFKNVLKARCLLEEQTIMKYAFAINKRPADDDPFVRRTEKVFNIKVEYLDANGYMKCLVLVKGLQKNWEKLQEATERLLQIFYFDRGEYITVNTVLELPVECHEILQQKIHVLRKIEQDTKTHIVFPKVTSESQSSAKNLQIKICGSIKGVYIARQCLVNRLPVAICINCSSTTRSRNLQKELKFFKPRNEVSLQVNKHFNSQNIVIEGTERNFYNMLRVSEEIVDILDSSKDKHQNRQESSISAVPTKKYPIKETNKEETIPKTVSLEDISASESSSEEELEIIPAQKEVDFSSAFDSNTEELKILYEKNNEICEKLFATDLNAMNEMFSTILDPFPKYLSKSSAGLWKTAVELNTKPMCNVVKDLLDYLQLEQYHHIFEKNNIGLEDLTEMDDEDLEDVGVCASGARDLILQYTGN